MSCFWVRFNFINNLEMKYTFEKFQIQLVSKPNSPFNKQCSKNSKISAEFQSKGFENERNIHTADQS